MAYEAFTLIPGFRRPRFDPVFLQEICSATGAECGTVHHDERLLVRERVQTGQQRHNRLFFRVFV